MAGNKFTAIQTVSKDVLKALYNSSNFFTNDTDNITLDDLLKALDENFLVPFYMSPSDSAGSLVVDVAPSVAAHSYTGLNRSTAPISGVIPVTSALTITFPATSGNNAVVSDATTLLINITSGNFLKVGLSINASGFSVLTAGTEGASIAAATLPAFGAEEIPVGYVVLENVAGTIQDITQDAIYLYPLTLPGLTKDSPHQGANRVTNKDFSDGSVRFVASDGSDVAIRFETGGTSGTSTLIAANQTANRILTLPDVSSALVARTSVDALTNKDIDGGTASNTNRITLPKNTTTNLNALTRKEGTLVYDTDTLQVKYDDGSVLNPVGAGGSGEINLIDNPNDANSGWAASGAGVTVVTTSTSTDLPLEGIIDNAIKITPVSGTDYVYYRFTISEALKNRKLKLQWEQRPLSGYASGDLKVEVHTNTASNYAGTDATLALSTDSSGVSAIPNLTGRYTTTFDTASLDYYEIRIIRVAGTTALNITNVIAGPGIQPQGAVVQFLGVDPFDLTFSAGFGATSARALSAWRVGSRLRIRGNVTCGTVAASTAHITLPSGYTIDDASFISENNTSSVGTMRRLNNTSTVFGNNITVALFYDGTTTNRLFVCNVMGSNTYNNENGNNLFTTNQVLDYEFEIPIAEWAGNGSVNLAQNDVEYASNSTTTDANDSTNFVYGPDGGPIPTSVTALRTKRVQFQTPILASDSLILEVKAPSENKWTAVDSVDNGTPLYFQQQNTTTYGMAIRATTGLDNRQVNVMFGAYASATGATYASAGTAWSGFSGGYRWRVRKVSNGNAVGFGQVSSTSAGLMPANLSNLDNVAATRMGLKEYLHGTTYNAGIAPTVTLSTGGGSLSAVNKAVFIPYQTQAGTWRLKFNINVTLSSTSRTEASVDVVGITFVNLGTLGQAVAAANNAAGAYISRSFCGPNNSNIKSVHASGTTSEYNYSGDVELTAKPTWAY